MAKEFTAEMFTVEDIEVLGTPIGTDSYIRNFLTQNCLKIVRDIEKLEPLTDGFTHSAQHRHVDTAIVNATLKGWFWFDTECPRSIYC